MKYFICKEKIHTTYNCFKKKKIIAISEGINKDSNNKGKKQLLPKSKKGVYLFFNYLQEETYFIKILLLFNSYKEIKLIQ